MLVYVVVSNNIDNITGVTFNSVSLTLLDTYKPNAGNWGANSGVKLFYLLNPANVSASIVISSSSGQNIYASAVSYSGVAQTGTFGTTSKVRTTTSPVSHSITTVNPKSAIFLGVGNNFSTAPTLTYTSPQTLRTNDTKPVSYAGEGIYTSAGTYSVQASWTGGAGNDVASIAVEMNASTS